MWLPTRCAALRHSEHIRVHPSELPSHVALAASTYKGDDFFTNANFMGMMQWVQGARSALALRRRWMLKMNPRLAEEPST